MVDIGASKPAERAHDEPLVTPSLQCLPHGPPCGFLAEVWAPLMKAIEDALGLAEQRAAEVQADRLSGSLWLSRADADNLWRLSEALQAAFTLIEAKRKEVIIDPFTEHPLHRAMASVLEMMLILHCRYPDDPTGVPHPLIPHH